MKFILIALLAGACLTVTWPSVSKTVTLSSAITVKAGQTYDGFKEYSNKWVRFEEEKVDLVTAVMLKVEKLMLVSFYIKEQL